jgi:hypothetical protein
MSNTSIFSTLPYPSSICVIPSHTALMSNNTYLNRPTCRNHMNRILFLSIIKVRTLQILRHRTKVIRTTLLGARRRRRTLHNPKLTIILTRMLNNIGAPRIIGIKEPSLRRRHQHTVILQKRGTAQTFSGITLEQLKHLLRVRPVLLLRLLGRHHSC